METYKGLKTEDIQRLTHEGKVNVLPKPKIKSNWQIISSHVFTLFNLYNIIIACALIYIKAYTSLFFMGILVSNTFMFSVQEIRSRNLINKLNILISPKTTVIRNGISESIDNEAIVLGDFVYLESGNQISADAIVVKGYVEVNESLLTGEIEPVDKYQEALLLSGSFIVSGTCIARVIHVGKENYASQVTNTVKQDRVIISELLKTFKTVTKITSFFIIPLGFLLIYQGLVVRQQPFDHVINNTATALLGMLPQGLVLLTTLNLIASVLKLGTKKTLVQDLYAVEMLSQIDVLCLDKTGTLTYGNMDVIETEVLDERFEAYIQSFLRYSKDNNVTFQALHKAFKGSHEFQIESAIPFSSARKWSAMEFKNAGGIILGAPEVVEPYYTLSKNIRSLRKKGARILLVAHYKQHIDKNVEISFVEKNVLAIIAIQDKIREDAHDALKFFAENDINVKIISGDNPDTVKSLSVAAGLDEQEDVIDATTLSSHEDYENAILNYNIIGRANPSQKLKFVEILQAHDLKVAMTGDGINDVMALKQANCSIAMGEGSDAALHISQVVIMDGYLSTLVDVFKEGRQVINNITMSASMYYLRTIMTIFMTMIAVFLNVPFPFIPFQVTLTNMFVDGFPSFMILFERNINKPKESILDHVLRHAFPNALSNILIWILINALSKALQLNQDTVQTMMFYLTAYISIQLIYRIYKPFNAYRIGVLIVDVIGIALGIAFFWNWLEIVPLFDRDYFILGWFVLLATLLIKCFELFITRYLDKKQMRS